MDINIPSQVKLYANVGAFPSTGSVKTIYIAEDTNIAYFWTGSAYQSISIQDLSGLFPNPTGTTSQYLRGDGSLATFPTIPDVSGLQSKPIVVNSNITAENDRVYHVIANATFTDPTPVQGRGYVVFIANGTVTLGGQPFTHNSIYYRIYTTGSWQIFRFDNFTRLSNFFVPQIRTINGLDLTANRTLTTANINDSANRRYVTDRGKDIANNMWRHINSLDSAPVTISPSNVVVRSVLIPAGTLTSNSVLKYKVKYDKEKTDGAVNMFVDINTIDSLSGSTNISRNGSINNNVQFINHERNFACDGSNLKEMPFSSNQQTPLNQNSRASYTPINTAVDNWLLFNVRLFGATDILRMIYLEIEICSQ